MASRPDNCSATGACAAILRAPIAVTLCMDLVDTLLCARWVLPMEPDDIVLEDHAVAIRAGRIVAVLPQSAALQRYRADQVLRRDHHALLPGLINAHTHAASTLRRGCALPVQPPRAGEPTVGLPQQPAVQASMDPDAVRDGAELAIAEMLRGGVTCFADVHPWPEIVARTAVAAQVRACIGMLVHGEPSAWAAGTDECIDKGLQLRDEYQGELLVSTRFSVAAPQDLDDGTLLRIRRLADELEAPVAMRLHGNTAEINQSLTRYGVRPLERVLALGLVNPLLVAIHMTQCTGQDTDTLAAAGAAVVHCPQSDLTLGNGVCPAGVLHRSGVTVGLGTGGADLNGDLDVLDEGRTALLLAGQSGLPSDSITPSDALRMATLGGARALGLSDTIGSLLPGKWADLCCLDLRLSRTWPVHDPVTTVLRCSASTQVTDTWVAGRHLYAEGQLRGLDEAALLERVARWGRWPGHTDSLRS